MSLLNSYIDLNFEVFRKADNSRYGNGNGIRLVNLSPVDLFSNFKLTTRSGIHLEDISDAQIIPSRYKLITSSRVSDDLSIEVVFNQGSRNFNVPPLQSKGCATSQFQQQINTMLVSRPKICSVIESILKGISH